MLGILKLKEMLEKANIPFTFTDKTHDSGYPVYKIAILDRENDKCELCDAMYFDGGWHGSYNYKQNKLEVFGAMTKEEYETHEEPIQALTADETFKRFKYCYENNTNTYKEVEVDKDNKEAETIQETNSTPDTTICDTDSLDTENAENENGIDNSDFATDYDDDAE